MTLKHMDTTNSKLYVYNLKPEAFLSFLHHSQGVQQQETPLYPLMKNLVECIKMQSGLDPGHWDKRRIVGTIINSNMYYNYCWSRLNSWGFSTSHTTCKICSISQVVILFIMSSLSNVPASKIMVQNAIRFSMKIKTQTQWSSLQMRRMVSMLLVKTSQ